MLGRIGARDPRDGRLVNRRLARLRAGLVRLGFGLGRLVPIRSRVVLATAHADRIGGNLAWIRDDLRARHPEVRLVVLARRPRVGLGQLRAVLDAIVGGWQLATSRAFVVDDYYFPMYAIRPRPGTTRLQVWHACGAFKKFGYGVLDKSFGVDEAFVADFPIHTNYDLCLVSAARFAPAYAEAFRLPLARFTARLGIPRTDLFFDRSRQAAAIAAIRSRYALPEGRRVILYAPTFRGVRITAARSPEDLDVDALAAALGSGDVLLVRAHPFVAALGRGPSGRAVAPAPPDGHGAAARVVDVSDWPDGNELLLTSDVLVTDYSSAIYEFALLGRPIAFFAPDHARYEAERGFYLRWPDDLPGPVFETTSDLAAFLRAGTFDLERVQRFRAESFDVADGRATARLVDEILLPALVGRGPAADGGGPPA